MSSIGNASSEFDLALLIWRATYEPSVDSVAIERGIQGLTAGGAAAVVGFCRAAATIADHCARSVVRDRIVPAGRLADRASRNILAVDPPPFGPPLAELAAAVMTGESEAVTRSLAVIERHARASLEVAVGACIEAAIFSFRTLDVSLQAADWEPEDIARRLRATTTAMQAAGRPRSVQPAATNRIPAPSVAVRSNPQTVQAAVAVSDGAPRSSSSAPAPPATTTIGPPVWQPMAWWKRLVVAVVVVGVMGGGAGGMFLFMDKTQPSRSNGSAAGPTEGPPVTTAATTRVVDIRNRCPRPLDEQPTGSWTDYEYERWEADDGARCFGPGGPLRSCGDDYYDNVDCLDTARLRPRTGIPTKTQLNARLDAEIRAALGG